MRRSTLIVIALLFAAALATFAIAGGAPGSSGPGAPGGGGETVHVLFTFTNVDKKPDLQRKFSVCIQSLFEHLVLPEKTTLVLHFVADPGSRAYGEKALARFRRPGVDFVFHDVAGMVQPIAPLIAKLQERFSSPGGNYRDPIFFLGVGLHRILPPEIGKVIKLDFDILLRSNVIDLQKELAAFQDTNVIGLGPELQPVYRRGLRKYRDENPTTRAGSPLPEGQPGLNAGVTLFDLDRMRRSEAYNAALEPAAIDALATKYHFKGHLGDQDFYTLLSFEHEELFYKLDCAYNRQLCTWWKDHSEPGVFDVYHACPGEPKIYHGNCSTAIPGAEAYEPAAAPSGSAP